MEQLNVNQNSESVLPNYRNGNGLINMLIILHALETIDKQLICFDQTKLCHKYLPMVADRQISI